MVCGGSGGGVFVFGYTQALPTAVVVRQYIAVETVIYLSYDIKTNVSYLGLERVQSVFTSDRADTYATMTKRGTRTRRTINIQNEFFQIFILLGGKVNN